MIAGTRLGPYEIVGALGAGGMGEVYKATDTRLGREVAIKVLPPHWMDSPDMQARFRQEAQTIASLNHPNICALHDMGHERPAENAEPVTFLVMELLEGETLAARLERGALDLNDALDIAIPIADALDQAHRRGVVHRDLKPANVMLTPNGPKLLDFGIAKAMTPAGTDATSAKAPTTPLTTPGLVIGTLQYMAPEQIEGLEADPRTDIFAFGAMLHEMVTGRKAFEAKSQVLLISAIATSDPPPLSAVQPRTPPALDHVVKACLAKDPDERWQTARDLLAELRWIAEGGAAATAVVPLTAAPSRRGRLVRVLLATAALLGLVTVVPAARYFSAAPGPEEVRYRVSLRLESLFGRETENTIAMSPDGTRLAFVGGQTAVGARTECLYVNRLGTLAYERLAGTENALHPFWSPDGQAIGYYANKTIRKVNTSGGVPQDVAQAASFFGGSWNAEGTIVFGTATGIFRVSAEGGSPEAVTSLTDGETGHYWPRFLPGGRRFLYLAWSSDANARGIFVGSLDGAAPVRVMDAESQAVYTRPTGMGRGLLVFHRGPAVFAQPFDEGALALAGEPERIADNVIFETMSGQSGFDVSADGVLAYWNDIEAGTGGSATGPGLYLWQAVWADSSNGQVLSAIGPEGVYRGVEVSPDGSRVAMHRHDDAGGDVWVIEPQGTRTRITFEAGDDNSMPVWSPDGAELAFSARRNGKWGLYRTRSDGTTDATLLYESDLPKVATSWTKDGHLVFWQEDPKTRGDLWMLSLSSASPKPGGEGLEPQPLITSPANERHGQVSPDGRWLAYTSDATETGVFQVYVRPFPAGTGRWEVSIAAADYPRWSRDGKTLFFREAIAPGDALAGIPLFASAVGARGDQFVYEPPQVMLRFRSINVEHPGGPYSTYAVSPDPKRMVVFQRFIPEATTAATTTGPPTGAEIDWGLMIARHWEMALKQR